MNDINVVKCTKKYNLLVTMGSGAVGLSVAIQIGKFLVRIKL